MSTITQPIKRHGGKSYLAPKLVELFPSHTRYLEPFFGGGSVLLARSGENVAEFVNDLELNLSHFWYVLGSADLFDEFARKVSCTPFSEEVFEAAKQRLKSRVIHGIARMPVDAAVDFFIVNRQSRQAIGKCFATPTRRLRRGMNEQVSAWLSGVEGLFEVHQRLARVEVRCKPAVEFIRELDSEESFAYCDPPYVPDTRTAKSTYQHEMTIGDHQELLNTLATIKGKFMLSGYPSEMYDDWAAVHGWNIVDFDLPNNASSKSTKERKIERVWMNY
jgi:DNA adenine methylase